ncbi:MAG: NlpC/P60 family protein, partial [Coriobacteriia bacterium]|nr:NlpC/P60 family protein [Coriobacteriia bacterium]
NPDNPDDPDNPGATGGEAIKDDPEPPGDLASYLDAQAEAKAAKGKHAKALNEKAKRAQAKYQEAARGYSNQAAANAIAPSAFNTTTNVYASAYAGANSGYTRIHMGTNLTTEMFIASIGEQARQIGQEKNLYASVMIAQAVIESDSGNSGLAQAPNNNLFGIKGAYEGNSVTMATQEDDGTGRLYGIDSAFRKYETQEESLKDYADLIRGDMDHYYKVWKENAKTYEDAAKALQGTYATSTVYADTICAVIDAYDLTRFDEPLEFTIKGKNADGEKLTMNDYAQLQANAVSFLGTPYVWGGTNPDEGFDCSGFVQYLYKQTFGISLPRTTYTQQYEGKEVAFDDLQMGDLLFFDEGGSTEHVAMYLGDGFYIHAPEQGDVIKITDMESFTPTFAKRILKLQEA